MSEAIYYCRKCGKRIDKPSYCRACWEEQRHSIITDLMYRSGRKLEGARVDNKIRIARVLDQDHERCITCAHSMTIGADGICCNYLCDAATFNLPKRPRPSADPWHCIYHAPSMERCCDLTREEAAALTDGRRVPVLDKAGCTIYTGLHAAASAAHVDFRCVAASCRKSEMQNINDRETRWRYLRPEERAMLESTAAHGPAGSANLDGKIQKIDSSGQVICTYNTIREAAEREALTEAKVYNRIRGITKTPIDGGYTFRYREEADE